MVERRQGMEELKKKIDHIQGYLESEFGGHSLSGQPTEGNMNRKFREYHESHINILKRIEILEKKAILTEKIFVYGSGFVAAFIVSFELIKVALSWFRK